MSTVIRLSDNDSESNTVIKASLTVFANNLGVARLGDTLTGDDNTIISASTTVFADGIPVARAGDKDSYPAVLVGGSPNVIVGG